MRVTQNFKWLPMVLRLVEVRYFFLKKTVTRILSLKLLHSKGNTEMSDRSVQEYLNILRQSYRVAKRPDKGRIIDEVCRNLGWHRKSAIRSLNQPEVQGKPIKRSRMKKYSLESRSHLKKAMAQNGTNVFKEDGCGITGLAALLQRMWRIGEERAYSNECGHHR